MRFLNVFEILFLNLKEEFDSIDVQLFFLNLLLVFGVLRLDSNFLSEKILREFFEVMKSIGPAITPCPVTGFECCELMEASLLHDLFNNSEPLLPKLVTFSLLLSNSR